jgi:hypothetical protein
MAINEACQVWIEQRIQEEKSTGKSNREIGRKIAEEIKKLFEAEMSPETIRKRVDRMVGTNVPPEATTANDEGKEGIKEIKQAKDGTQRGGQREGAGRKPKVMSQQKVWEKVERDLTKLVAWMENHCKYPAKTKTGIEKTVKRLIQTLTIFSGEM